MQDKSFLKTYPYVVKLPWTPHAKTEVKAGEVRRIPGLMDRLQAAAHDYACEFIYPKYEKIYLGILHILLFGLPATLDRGDFASWEVLESHLKTQEAPYPLGLLMEEDRSTLILKILRENAPQGALSNQPGTGKGRAPLRFLCETDSGLRSKILRERTAFNQRWSPEKRPYLPFHISSKGYKLLGRLAENLNLPWNWENRIGWAAWGAIQFALDRHELLREGFKKAPSSRRIRRPSRGCPPFGRVLDFLPIKISTQSHVLSAWEIKNLLEVKNLISIEELDEDRSEREKEKNAIEGILPTRDIVVDKYVDSIIVDFLLPQFNWLRESPLILFPSPRGEPTS